MLGWINKVRSKVRYKMTNNVVHTISFPGLFFRRGEGGREKTLASTDHVTFKHPVKLVVKISFSVRLAFCSGCFARYTTTSFQIR